MHTLKIRQRAWAILASACTIALVSGCGGGVEPIAIAQEAGLQAAQYSLPADKQPAHVTADSITVNPTKEFNGFNPELWNDRKAWYECDCGRHPQPQQAKVMTWNPV